jgi:hypothetical protein
MNHTHQTCSNCSHGRLARYMQHNRAVCEPCVTLSPQWAPTCLECRRIYPLIDGDEYPGCVCYDLDTEDSSVDGDIAEFPEYEV